MTYQTLQQFNATGTDDILLYVATQVPVFIPGLLIMIWLVTTLSLFYGSKRANGDANFFIAGSVGGFLTTIIAILMTLKDGLINTMTLVICVAVTMGFIIGMFFSRER